MADEIPRRVSLRYLIGLKKKPFKDPPAIQPPPQPSIPKTTVSSSCNCMFTTTDW